MFSSGFWPYSMMIGLFLDAKAVSLETLSLSFFAVSDGPVNPLSLT